MAIQINDEAGILSPGDISTLHSTAGRWPFEVHVITSTTSADKAAFETRVSAAVTAPNVVAIGIDPTRRIVIAHFGTETGIAASQWPAITSAGNADFKNAMWAQGLMKIADRAVAAKQASLTLQSPSDGSLTLTFVGLGLAAAFLAVFSFVWWRSKRRQAALEQRMAGAWSRSGPVRGRGGAGHDLHARLSRPPQAVSDAGQSVGAHHDIIGADLGRQPLRGPRRERPRAVPVPAHIPAPQHTHHDHARSNNDLVTGILIGNAMHHPPPPPPSSPPPPPAPSMPSSSWGGSSYDSGGSSSSFGGGGGGGFDSGGGSSSW